jgi:hypothetical protein
MVFPHARYLEAKANWPTPNYINPVTRGWDLVVANFVLLAFIFIIVGLRIYTRLRISRYFGVDDILILLATVSQGLNLP